MFYGKTSGDGAGAGRGNRNERYDQMIRQQQLIEQKKQEIQARLEADRQKKEIEELGRQKSSNSSVSSSSGVVGTSPTSSSSTSAVSQRNPSDEDNNEKEEEKKPSVKQVFSNDGSFFEQFKKMQEEALKKKKEEDEKAAVKKIKEEPIEYDDYGNPIRNNNKPAIKILHQETIERSAPPQNNNNNNRHRPYDGPPSQGGGYYNVPPPPPPPPPKNQDIKPYYGGNSGFHQNVIPPPPPPPLQPGIVPKLFGGFPSPAVRALASIVAEKGDYIEEELRVKHQGDPLMWFLFKPDSAEYRTFRSLVAEIQSDCRTHMYNQAPPPPPIKVEQKFIKAEPVEIVDYRNNEFKTEFKKNDSSPNLKRELSSSDGEESDRERRERKRRSRWGPQSDKVPPVGVVVPPPAILTQQPPTSLLPLPPQLALAIPGSSAGINLMNMPLMDVQSAPSSLIKVTRANPQILAYAKQAYGRTDLDEEEWKQCEEAYKMNMIFQDIAKKKAKDEEMKRAGKFKHEYDSDEEVDADGGTWEHRQRMKEMEKTRDWADELTSKAKGKHHIGDFLPPEELSKFMEKYKAVKEGKQLDESEYQEYKIQQDNIGFKMLQKMGWSSGEGLGAEKQGIVAPIDKGNAPSDKQGLGVEKPGDVTSEDDEFTAYRKRMMLAYRFRPNPLNNPRRAYY